MLTGFKLWVTSAVVLSGIHFASPRSESGTQELFVPANDVSFKIRCERKAYKIGEQVKFTYTARNDSGAAVFVPRLAWSATCPASPKVWAWFEDSRGKHFIPGFAGSCSPMQMSVVERMKKEAVLLKPRETYRDYFLLETKTFKDSLTPGQYRVEAAFYGWREDEFSEAQKAELRQFRHSFLRGESAASVSIELTK